MLKSAAAAFALALGIAGPALAADPVPFTKQAFAEAQSAGKPILVEVTAPWCPTCAKQRPILADLEKTPDFGDLAVFDVDYDSQKDVLKAFKVQKQSTLLVFRGADEKGRATGITDPVAIKDLLSKVKPAA